MNSWLTRLKHLLSAASAKADSAYKKSQAAVFEPTDHKVLCVGPAQLHNMAYRQWGDPNNPRVLICVHGLTRNARDFDYFAKRMSEHYRVICPDVVGRGQSDWLDDGANYIMPTYVADMLTLIARLNVRTVDWVGTSMGGLIGMMIASYPSHPIGKLVLNDIGAEITPQSLRRIAKHVGRAPRFNSLDEAVEYIKTLNSTFGLHTEEQWQHLAEHSIKPDGENGFVMRYDPKIGDAFRLGTPLAGVVLWQIYDAITSPTLVLRGEQSDLLTEQVLNKMTLRGPRARAVQIPNVGHAPTLMHAEQVDIVEQFLLEPKEEVEFYGEGLS